MQISHDFTVRLLGVQGIKLPMLKSEVDDNIFKNLISIAGGHQRMLDIRGCINISPSALNLLSYCNSLQYLDVSFTQLTDISVVTMNCRVLRSLQLCALDITDYEPLKNMVTLEILNLRGSSFHNPDILKGLLMLRSLDLGQTAIASIHPLTGMTRLEELQLDECTNIINFDRDQLLEILENLISLRCINFSEGMRITGELKERILSLPEDDLCIESSSKRLQFLDAVCNNLPEKIRELCETGVDVNIRAGPWADALITGEWNRRCKLKKVNTPFFMASHSNVELRPTALHLALFFNNQEAVRMLLEMGAITDLQVWIADVLLTNGTLTHNAAVSSKKALKMAKSQKLVAAAGGGGGGGSGAGAADEAPTTDFSMRAFIFEICDRKVHRIATTSMNLKRQPVWEKLCREIREQLLWLVEASWLRVNDKTALLSTYPGADNPTDDVDDLSVGHSVYSGSKASLVEGHSRTEDVHRDHDDHHSTSSVDAYGEEYVEEDDVERRQEQSPQSPRAVTSTDPSRSEGADVQASDPATEEADIEGGAENEDDGIDTDGKPIKKKKNRNEEKLTVAPPQLRRDWKEHVMVKKLIGDPQMMPSSITGHMIPMLGRRSFWMESRVPVVQEKLRTEAAVYAKMLQKRHGPAAAALVQGLSILTVDQGGSDTGIEGFQTAADFPVTSAEAKEVTIVSPMKKSTSIVTRTRSPPKQSKDEVMPRGKSVEDVKEDERVLRKKGSYDFPIITNGHKDDTFPIPERMTQPPIEERKQEFLELLQRRNVDSDEEEDDQQSLLSSIITTDSINDS